MSLRPIERSKLRLIAGKCYFTSKRYLYWIFGGVKFYDVWFIFRRREI